MVYGIFYYLINGIAWYCFVLYCVVGFGARAVSRKTPIYFIFFCREKEDRVLHFHYRSLLAEQRPLEVKAATGGHCRAIGRVVASGPQEVKGTEV